MEWEKGEYKLGGQGKVGSRNLWANQCDVREKIERHRGEKKREREGIFLIYIVIFHFISWSDGHYGESLGVSFSRNG